MSRPLVPYLFLAAVAAAGCADRGGYRLVVDDEEVSHPVTSIEVALGSPCVEQPPGGPFAGVVEEIVLVRGDDALPVFGDVEPGVYGLVARAVGEACQVVAWGCRDHALRADGRGEIAVDLDPFLGPVLGDCETRADAADLDGPMIATLYSPACNASRPGERPSSR